MAAFYQQGRYRARITNQGFGEQENDKRTPFFFLQIEPLARLVADGDEELCEQNYSRTVKLYVTEKTIERTRENLISLGWDGAKFRDLDPATVPGQSFIGNEIEVSCKHEAGVNDKADQTYEKWELPYEGGALEPKASDVKVANKLDALFGKKATPPKKPAAKPPAARQTAGVASGDGTERDGDIPFSLLVPLATAFLAGLGSMT